MAPIPRLRTSARAHAGFFVTVALWSAWGLALSMPARAQEGPAADTAPDPSSASLLASDTSPFTEPTLTLAQALQRAWTDNPRILEAQQAITAAGHELTGSYGGFLPTVQISNLSGTDSVSTVQASLALWSGGMTLSQIRASEAREVIARANLDQVRLEVGLDTLRTFHDLAEAQAQFRQFGAYIDALSGLQATIQRRLEHGVARESEVRTAGSRIDQARVGMEGASLKVMLRRNDLRQLLGSYPEHVEVSDSRAAAQSILPLDLPRAVDQQPEVLIAAARVAEQSEKAKQARAQLSPEVALQYRHYYGGGRAFDDTANEPQLVVQYQVGNTFAALQKKRAEEARTEGAKSALENARRSARAELGALEQMAASARLQRDLQERASASTQALVESFLRQYQAGNRSWIEVLNAQREAHEGALGAIAARRAATQGEQQLLLQSLHWGLLTQD